MAAMTPAITAASAIRFADAAVFHARLRPHGLRFRYSVLALFVDIDRLAEARRIPFFSVGRFNLFGFNPQDHGARDDTPLRSYLDGLHRDAGLARPAHVYLVCFPRILGYVFNPISTYCCADEEGRTTSFVYEVRNTFGERHTYLFKAESDASGRVAAHECDKLFYVSPFMDMPLRYKFLTQPPDAGHFSLKIIERDHAGVVLTALMAAHVFEPTRAALLLRLAMTPLVGFKVIVGIHWQALRLWLKGHHLRARPLPPAPVSIAQPGPYSLSTENHSSSHHA